MRAWPGEEFAIRLLRGDRQEEILVEAADPYRLPAEDFHAALLDGKPMEISLEDSLADMSVLDEVLRSIRPR